MRGAPEQLACNASDIGIIPADAGSTFSAVGVVCLFWDHPRGCGEHSTTHRMGFGMTGSSPRMRGALFVLNLAIWLMRIIPADAGSTKRLPFPFLANKDHPRGCGEHGWNGDQGKAFVGSSPRMRGAPIRWREESIDHGIIPADAGSTPQSCMSSSAKRDHPRGCGEHPLTCVWSMTMAGSSPRMRGARRPAGPDPRGWRIIPADAGSTSHGTGR